MKEDEGMIFSSERLNYRLYEPDDFADFYRVFSDREIMKYAWIDAFVTEEEASDFWIKLIHNNQVNVKGNSSDKKAWAFYVTDVGNGRYIGYADIEITAQNSTGGEAEIGYFILREAWGRGYGQEIGQALCRFCFENLGLHRAFARCQAENGASEGVMKSIGMKKEGLLRKARYKNGQWEDELRYAVLKEEFILR